MIHVWVWANFENKIINIVSLTPIPPGVIGNNDKRTANGNNIITSNNLIFVLYAKKNNQICIEANIQFSIEKKKPISTYLILFKNINLKWEIFSKKDLNELLLIILKNLIFFKKGVDITNMVMKKKIEIENIIYFLFWK